MPRVVFGATVLGNLFTAPTDKQKRHLVESWIDAADGRPAIDTAGKYGAGLSLEVIRRELEALSVDPADVIISNKLAWRRVPLTSPEPTFEPGVWVDLQHDAVQDISRDGILRCYEDGCRLLGDYRPHLVAVHDPDEYLAAGTDPDDAERRLTDLTEALRTLGELRDTGQVAGVGVGSKDWQVIKRLHDIVPLDWAMFANSFTIMNHPPELCDFLDTLNDDDVGVINSAVTHGGFLVGGDFFDYRKVDSSHDRYRELVDYRKRLTLVCDRHDVSVFDACVAFGGSHPAIHSLALSSSRPERTSSLVQAATKTLPIEFWQDVRDSGLIRRGYSYVSDHASNQ